MVKEQLTHLGSAAPDVVGRLRVCRRCRFGRQPNSFTPQISCRSPAGVLC